MKKLSINEMKKVTGGMVVSYEGCVGNNCCISIAFSEEEGGGGGTICGSIDWYFDNGL